MPEGKQLAAGGPSPRLRQKRPWAALAQIPPSQPKHLAHCVCCWGLATPRQGPSPNCPPLQVGGIRVRQHVNPLKRDLQVPAAPLAWEEVYGAASRPLVVDVGTGYGRFLLALSRAMPGHNMLGLEVRDQVWRGVVYPGPGAGLRSFLCSHGGGVQGGLGIKVAWRAWHCRRALHSSPAPTCPRHPGRWWSAHRSGRRRWGWITRSSL